MKTVVKTLVFNRDKDLLVLFRSKTHPVWPLEVDLPGGNQEEDDQNSITTAIRELLEETGIKTNPSGIKEVFSKQVSKNKIHKVTRLDLDHTPKIEISWEHSSYKWVKIEQLLKKEFKTYDDYFETAYEYLSSI